MDFLFFRIRDFRSIVDSEWQPFSSDGVTVLIGQNESGKTAVLDALARTFSVVDLTLNDCRVGAPTPTISLQIRVGFDEFEEKLEGWGTFQRLAVQTYLAERKNTLELEFSWNRQVEDGRVTFDGQITVVGNEIDVALESAYTRDYAIASVTELAKTLSKRDDGAREWNPSVAGMTSGDLGVAIMNCAPKVFLFDPDRNLLPNVVEINEEGVLTGEGKSTAHNYLRAAHIRLADLLQADSSNRKSLLDAGQKRVNDRLRTFFTVGEDSLPVPRIQCRLERESIEGGGYRRYLTFWTADGDREFYPAQRSRGLRWFVSLFLLIASSERLRTGRLLLLDEPGAWLHIKAQAHLLALFNNRKEKLRIVYTTHSPQLIEYDKLYRVLAVQRTNDQLERPSQIINAAHLGSASSDTLSPLFKAIGADFSHQQNVQKQNNVLLEEISGFYYFTAFWILTKCKQPAYFLAATGADKVLQLSFLMCGWGLDFIVAIDDDKKGLELRNRLGRALYGGDAAMVDRNVILNSGCEGIEDVFSPTDFARFVARRELAPVGTRNSSYVKQLKLSKPFLASQFLLDVKAGKVSFEALDAQTRQSISVLVERICTALKLR